LWGGSSASAGSGRPSPCRPFDAEMLAERLAPPAEIAHQAGQGAEANVDGFAIPVPKKNVKACLKRQEAPAE
jgi:hypothetical protein